MVRREAQSRSMRRTSMKISLWFTMLMYQPHRIQIFIELPLCLLVREL